MKRKGGVVSWGPTSEKISAFAPADEVSIPYCMKEGGRESYPTSRVTRKMRGENSRLVPGEKERGEGRLLFAPPSNHSIFSRVNKGKREGGRRQHRGGGVKTTRRRSRNRRISLTD